LLAMSSAITLVGNSPSLDCMYTFLTLVKIGFI
jgi:hypothetical protein